MKIKVTRTHLQLATIGLLVILLGYAALKFGFNVNMGKVVDDNLVTVIIFCALGIFGWNRYMIAEEKKALEAEEAKKKAEEEAAGEGTSPDQEPKKLE